MKTEQKPADREVLAGLVARVTYENAENGCCVIRVLESSYLMHARRRSRGTKVFFALDAVARDIN